MTNKNELKKEYKRTSEPMGIVMVKNLVNGKIYIESNKNVNARVNRFKFTLKYGVEVNKPLQEDYKKYGEDNFSIEVIDLLKPKEDDININYDEELASLELWLEKLQPYDEKGYNVIEVKK